jgi:hypothetical protein
MDNYLYFVYQSNSGYKFVSYIRALEIAPNGALTIYFDKEIKTFTPNEGDIYKCGDTFYFYNDPSRPRWVQN